MEFIAPKAEQYAASFSTALQGVLLEIEAYTMEHHRLSHMLSGQVQGQFLSFISQLQQPQTVLEVGTFTGFSALCLASGLAANGILHTIELREEDAAVAQSFFDKAKASNIKLHQGNALEIIPQLDLQWDLVFLDADKVSYIQYYELVLPKLKPGGIILADNVLFHGQVLEEEITGKNAKAIHAFNEHVAKDTRVLQVLLTLRDGLMIIKKL